MKHGMHGGKGDKGGHPGNLKMPETTKDDSQSKANSAAGGAKSGGGKGKGSKGVGDATGGMSY